MQCLILAGGLGTRMLPRTEKVPKALLPVKGEPFLHHQLRHLRYHGVDEVVLSIGHLGGQIREVAGDGRHWGMKIQYSDEGDDLRGTGGALRLAADRGLLRETFLLTYGDSFLPIDFGAVHNEFLKSGFPMAMCVYRNKDQWDKSNVLFVGQNRLEYNKHSPRPEMEHIDYGLFGLYRETVLTHLPPEQRTDFADLIFALSQKGLVFGIEAPKRFYEIGSPQGLSDLEHYLSASRQK